MRARTLVSLVSLPLLLAASLAPVARAEDARPLDEYIASALRQNPSRGLSRAALATAEAERLHAASDLLPTLRARGSWTYNQYESVTYFQDPAGGPPQKIIITPHENLDASATARVPLLDGPAFAKWRAARAGASAAGDEDRASEQDVALAVSRAYFNALAAQEVLRAAERAQSVAAENHRIVTARLKAGAATPLFEKRAELEVLRAEQTLIEARRGWAAARRSLASLSGLPEPDAIPAVAPSTDPAPDEAGLLAQAESRRPDLLAARARVAESRRTRNASRLSFAPTVAAEGTERYTNATGFSGKSTSWSAGVVAEWLLFDVGARHSDLKRDRAEILRATSRADELTLAVRDELHSAWLDVDSARAKVVAARRGDEVARAAAEETRTRFNAGTATQLDVIQSDRDALQAEVDRIRAEVDLSIARAALKKAAGESLTAR